MRRKRGFKLAFSQLEEEGVASTLELSEVGDEESGAVADVEDGGESDASLDCDGEQEAAASALRAQLAESRLESDALHVELAALQAKYAAAITHSPQHAQSGTTLPRASSAADERCRTPMEPMTSSSRSASLAADGADDALAACALATSPRSTTTPTAGVARSTPGSSPLPAALSKDPMARMEEVAREDEEGDSELNEIVE